MHRPTIKKCWERSLGERGGGDLCLKTDSDKGKGSEHGKKFSVTYRPRPTVWTLDSLYFN